MFHTESILNCFHPPFGNAILKNQSSSCRTSMFKHVDYESNIFLAPRLYYKKLKAFAMFMKRHSEICFYTSFGNAISKNAMSFCRSPVLRMTQCFNMNVVRNQGDTGKTLGIPTPTKCFCRVVLG